MMTIDRTSSRQKQAHDADRPLARDDEASCGVERMHTDGPDDRARAPSSGQGLLAAMRLTLPLGRMGAHVPPSSYARASAWVVPIGLVIGLAWIGVFRGTWRIYGYTAGLILVPSLAIVVVECCFTGAFLLFGTVHTVQKLTGRRGAIATDRDGHQGISPESLTGAGVLTLCLCVLCLWVFLVSIPYVTPWWPSVGWRTRFNFLYPSPIYRPLLLAPLWGRWGILVAACVGRTGQNADEPTREFCAAMRPSRLLLHAVMPLALSAVFCAREGKFLIGIEIGLIVFGVTYLASVYMARRGGGQTRQSLWAAGQVAQLSFLAVHRAFWPLIHGY